MSQLRAQSAEKEMPFFAHLTELRHRLIKSIIAVMIATCAGFVFYDSYIGILIRPFGESLYIVRIEQGFTTKVKIAIYAGLLLSSPIHLYNLVAFVLPALTGRERRIVAAGLCGSFALAIVGGSMAYFKILPLAVEFLKSSAFVPTATQTWLDFKGSVLFVCQIVAAFIILFQLPLVLLLLMTLNVIDRHQLFQYSRYIIIVIFVISALVTPPDVVSQLGLACPLIILFYTTILLAKLLHLGEQAP